MLDRYEDDENMHRRNWLLVWQMEGRCMDFQDLHKKTGIHLQHLNKFMLEENKEKISKTCELICKALQCQPRDIGWGLKFDSMKSPYRLDITAMSKLLDVYISGLGNIHGQMKILKEDIARIQSNILEQNF